MIDAETEKQDWIDVKHQGIQVANDLSDHSIQDDSGDRDRSYQTKDPEQS